MAKKEVLIGGIRYPLESLIKPVPQLTPDKDLVSELGKALELVNKPDKDLVSELGKALELVNKPAKPASKKVSKKASKKVSKKKDEDLL